MPTFRNTLSVPSSQAGRYDESLHFICQRFGTHCLFHLHRRLGMNKFVIPTRLWRWNRQSVPKRWHIEFRHRELPRRKHTTIRTRRKFEIKNVTLFINDPSSLMSWVGNFEILHSICFKTNLSLRHYKIYRPTCTQKRVNRKSIQHHTAVEFIISIQERNKAAKTR